MSNMHAYIAFVYSDLC